MSRTLSLAALTSVHSRSSAEQWLGLIRIIDPDPPNSVLLRFVVNDVQIISNGQVYLPFFVDIRLQDEVGDSVPQAELVVDAVDQTIVAALSGLTKGPVVDVEYVLASDPDTVLIQSLGLRTVGYKLVSNTLTMQLEGPDYLNERIPGRLMTMAITPGLFK